MNESERDAFLKDEYILLQGQYEDYDNRSITIKGWVASGATVAIALGFSTTHKFSYLIPVAVGIIVVSIWYLETYWKLFQYALRPRIQVIEAHFRADPQRLYPDPAPFQIYEWWFCGYRRYFPVVGSQERSDDGVGSQESPDEREAQRISAMAVGFQAFVMIPYAPICVVCAISSLILLFNPPLP